MVAMDGKRRIQKVWGGYSPKYYDGDFLEVNEDWFLEHCKNDKIVADNHFHWGRDKKGFPIVYSNYAKGDKAGPAGGMVDAETLTQRKQQYNDAVAYARARVETPFGEVRGLFKALQKPFPEDPAQLDRLVHFAFGIFNFRLSRS
jgi:hypothetical protein